MGTRQRQGEQPQAGSSCRRGKQLVDGTSVRLWGELQGLVAVLSWDVLLPTVLLSADPGHPAASCCSPVLSTPPSGSGHWP
jgi:hypothetical protein